MFALTKSPSSWFFLAIEDNLVIALKIEYLGSFISPNNSLNTLLPLPITVGILPSGSLAYLPFKTVLAKLFITSGVSAPKVKLVYLKNGSSPFGLVLGTLSKTFCTMNRASWGVISLTVFWPLCVNLEYLWKTFAALSIASSVGL